jgi:sulfate transport system permease protein
MRKLTVTRLAMRLFAIVWLTVLLLAPVSMVFVRAFDHGFEGVWRAVSSDYALHALELTGIATVSAVVLNTIFGVIIALVLVRSGAALWISGPLNIVVDLPFAISPVVVGLALLLTWGENAWLGSWAVAYGLDIIYSMPGIILATVLVTVPFVVREVVPVLHEVGTEQEQAAATLGAGGWSTFWRVTLPSIRWGVTYGVVLTTARALGEYGAVAVVSGKISGETETVTTRIEASYQLFDLVAVYALSVVLAVLALLTLGFMTALASRQGASRDVH